MEGGEDRPQFALDSLDAPHSVCSSNAKRETSPKLFAETANASVSVLSRRTDHECRLITRIHQLE